MSKDTSTQTHSTKKIVTEVCSSTHDLLEPTEEQVSLLLQT